MSVVVAVLLILAACLCWHHRRTYSFWSKRGIAGPTPVPLLGNSLSLMLTRIPQQDLLNRHKFGRVYGAYDGTQPVLVVSDASLVRQVYQTQFSHFADQFHADARAHEAFHLLNLVVLTGDKWRSTRRVFNRSLTASRIRQMNSLVPIPSLMRQLEASRGQSLDLTRVMARFVTSAASAMLTGLHVDLLDQDEAQAEALLEAVDEVFTSLSVYNTSFSRSWLLERLPASVSRLLRLNRRMSSCTESYRQLIARVVQQRQTASDQSRHDLLQGLLDAQAEGTLGEEDVVANAMVAGIAASGPTVVATVCLLWQLARHPLHQRRVQQELDRVLGDETASLEAVERLPLLQACLKESLRLHPTEARSFRRVSSAAGAVLPSLDVLLPRGTAVQVAHVALHRDASLWPQPDSFSPERFLGRDVPACAFMAFGSGPRMCPGARLAQSLVTLTAASVLRDYDLCSPAPDQLLYPRNSMILSTEAVRVTLRRRLLPDLLQ